MKSPSSNIILYMLLHAIFGLLLSTIRFEDYPSIANSFLHIDKALPTYRTFFVYSSDPTGCKILLTLWWLVLLPLGVIWSGKYSKGFKYTQPEKFVGRWKKIKLLAIGVGFSSLILYQNSLADHTEKLNISVGKNGIGAVIPALISYGPWGLSIYLAMASLLAVMGITLMLMIIREELFR